MAGFRAYSISVKGNDGLSCACPLIGGTVHRKGGPDMAEINSPGGPLSAGDQILFRDRPPVNREYLGSG